MWIFYWSLFYDPLRFLICGLWSYKLCFIIRYFLYITTIKVLKHTWFLLLKHLSEIQQRLKRWVWTPVMWNDLHFSHFTCEGLTRWPWSHSTRLSAVESGIWQRRLSLSSVSIISRTLLRSSKRWSALKLPMKGEVGDWQSNMPFE